MAGRLIGGRYEIVRKIAEGGMGAVYEAQHHLTKQTVALKILFPHIGRDENARQRFLREVSAPAQIGHDGIVEVHDAGFDTQDGSLFVAMELLRGETMRDRLSRGGLTRDQVLDLFEAMLDPLAAAHARGIVHRDLKPENVFLHRERDGREVLKLLDFGIARDLDEKSQSVTQTGMAMGTPHYMAPEQAMSARSVSFPADVWAVGAMLYEALSGSPPFGGETASAIVVHAVSKPHEPLAHVAPATPHAIALLVDRCLAKEADKRPKDARELLGELRVARGKSAGIATGPVAPSQVMLPISPPQSYGTPSHQSYGAAPAQHATPQPSYGAHVPSASHPSFGGVPTPPPGHVTPPPAVSPVPRSSSGSGRILVIGGLVIGLGLLAVVGVVAVGAYAAFSGSATGAQGTGTVRVMTTIPGQLVVDGAPQGPVLIGGQDVVLSAGSHVVEVQIAGATLASQRVDVSAGQVQQIELVRGVVAGAGGSTGGAGVHSGTLGPGDQTLSTGEYMDFYEMSFSAGQHVHLELASPSFDTYLILRFPSGRQRDNDDATGTNSMLDQTLDETGVYRVIVTSFSAGETGPYTLTIR
ncbi:serine/threonine-protein kinase [Sandaracinus amylolyticus]|uniref:serine/threonine-protein kinase n=1 Tax=Sandaracinus amylolyticus TaxID=927083 RepID=UPI001F2FA1BF|nr:serine/threonine-protein kinase [Sandaracinus amylolyticus]UJR82388.1 Hypothetical protein I5071_44530 [Sandaracinus amylolyticus]